MNNMFFDSRKNFEALDGLVLLFPLPQDTLDAFGEDINQVRNLNLLSFATRLRAAVTGPDAFGASTSGLIEIDFTSRANSVTLRFRQAWVKLAWENSDLLVGRAWHPMSSTDVAPAVSSLNWGAPFQPFNRSAQITFTRYSGNISMIGSLIFQNDYTSNGPAGKTYLYQTNSLHPEIHAQIKYKSENFIIGAGADYKKILPRTHTVSPVTGKKYKTNEAYNSLAYLVYAQVKTGKLTIAAKSIYATNISENLMAGAFGISAFDSATGREKYTPYKHWYIWGNIMYGTNLKAGVFAGYFKNLGAKDDLVENTPVYGLGENIASMYRISPIISYTKGKVTLASEVECNIAAYGKINYSDKGRITDAEKITGMRVLLSLNYVF